MSELDTNILNNEQFKRIIELSDDVEITANIKDGRVIFEQKISKFSDEMPNESISSITIYECDAILLLEDILTSMGFQEDF